MLCDDVAVCERDMKKSAMRKRLTNFEATPASLSSQASFGAEYADVSAPLVWPLAGTT